MPCAGIRSRAAFRHKKLKSSPMSSIAQGRQSASTNPSALGYSISTFFRREAACERHHMNMSSRPVGGLNMSLSGPPPPPSGTKAGAGHRTPPAAGDLAARSDRTARRRRAGRQATKARVSGPDQVAAQFSAESTHRPYPEWAHLSRHQIRPSNLRVAETTPKAVSTTPIAVSTTRCCLPNLASTTERRFLIRTDR
eukprot:CAMPEP_0172207868 /NCGR_PEP_ID=MMETSP1050-20130122/34110_1 /TAXON_ID=233186 /ORGANISM="Cryptomonas curvata, Strain CCAP979/52" /LENGTH=195 /DNA_ID=CAMNT_0012887305 /DNA_START=211 /DNA_END=798 /DNA_ORIENTATION=+